MDGSQRALRFGLASASGAVIAGCLLLLAAGAPLRMPLINFAALLIGIAGLMILRGLSRLLPAGRHVDWLLVVASLAVPLTALVGAGTDGVVRWVVVGGLTLQPAMMIVPPLAVSFALRPSLVRAAAVAVAAVGTALQPDPAAAAMLASACALALFQSPSRGAGALAALSSAVAFAVALATAPVLPPTPFVEGVLPAALASGAATGVLALAGVLLLFMPALPFRRSQIRREQLAFIGLWLACFGAALTGHYPTPVIGFGGSAVVGYILSVGLLSRPSRSAAATARRSTDASRDGEAGFAECRVA